MSHRLLPVPLLVVKLRRTTTWWAASVATESTACLVAANARPTVVRAVLGALPRASGEEAPTP